MVLFTVQFMAWSFVCKLNRIGKTMQKYAVLNIVSISFTTIYAVFAVICVFVHIEMDHSELVYLEQTVLAVVVVMDVFIDTICMTLSLSVNDQYYRYCCYLCAKHRLFSEQLDTANGVNSSYFVMDDSDKTSSTVRTPTWIRFAAHRGTTASIGTMRLSMPSVQSSFL